MATINYTGTTGNDSLRLASYGQPGSANTYTFNGLAGTDTFDFVTGNSYASRFISTNFTIGAADANGMIVVSGASSGGKDQFTLNLTSVESIKFSDKTVSLSYPAPVTPTPTDTTPPTVSAYSPAGGALGVAPASDIVLTFSEAIQKGSGLIEIHSGSAAGSLVASYDAATSANLSVSGTTLTINPTNDLANGTHYFVTLAAGSVKDLAGNSYAGTTAYDFSTAALPVDTTPPTVSSFSPAGGALGVAVASDIVLTFSEAIQKGSGLIEIHSGSAAGTLVASYDAATSTNLTVSGNILDINPTADLANGTHYFVTLAAGSVKDLAGNSYAGTTAYDFSTAAASGTPDTTPPTVSSFSPAGGAQGVAVASDIVLTFSEPVTRGTGFIEIHSGSATGTLVASYNAATSSNLTVAGSTLTINPTADLATGTHYFVTLAGGSIKDSAGNSYAGTAAYDFTTAAAAVTTDTTPPVVVTFSPAEAATGVSISTDIVLTFNEAIQKGTGTIAIHSASPTGLIVASSDDPMTESISISGTTLTIHPVNNLSPNTHYYVTFGQASINDLAGNHFDSATPFDFTTVPLANIDTVTASNYTAQVIAGVGVLGVLAWILI